MQNKNLQKYVSEVIGTYILVFVGTASVATALYIGVLMGIFQVAILWGIGLALAIYATAPHSGAHLNPAITLALYFLRKNDMDIFQVLGYIASQLVGAILAGISVLIIFGPFIDRFEILNKITRGGEGSELTASAFGEYFPNPDILPHESGAELVNAFHALGVEAFATAVLAFVIFMSLDPKSALHKTSGLAPLIIGLTLTLLISLFGSITQAGLNPARDFGPRLVAFFAGWEKIAIPGPHGGFWIYILGPIIGAPIGGLLYDKVFKITDKK